MKIQPIGYRCLIEQVKEGKTKGGLILPENATEKGLLGRGVIKKVGKSKWLKEGDKVYYRKVATDEFELDGKKYNLVKNKYIYAKFKD